MASIAKNSITESSPNMFGDKAKQVVSYYQETIFMLAFRLTNDEELADEVLDEVSVDLYDLLSSTMSEPLETAVHRLTYESSISKLLENLNSRGASVEQFVETIAH